MVKLQFESCMLHYMTLAKFLFVIYWSILCVCVCVCVCQMYPVIQVSVLVTAGFISLGGVLPCKGKGEVSMLTKHLAIMTW